MMVRLGWNPLWLVRVWKPNVAVCTAMCFLSSAMAVSMENQEAAMTTTQSVPIGCTSSSFELHLEADRHSAAITRLGWDTEGTNRASINLLKAPVQLRATKRGAAMNPPVRIEMPDAETIRYCHSLGTDTELVWEIAAQPDKLRMQVSATGHLSNEVDTLEMVFPFEPATAVTCVISSNWTTDGRFAFPAILSAPDLGQLLMTATSLSAARGRVEGSRSERWVTMTLELPASGEGVLASCEFTPLVLPVPAGFGDERQWHAARRGWFNLIQLSCGASGGGHEIAGVWANNVLSDPVSSVLYMLADATLLVPELAPGVSMPSILRRTVEYWIDHKTNEDGLIAYTAGGVAGRESASEEEGDPSKNQNVMDSNPSVLIGAWAYVKATGDTR